MKCDFPGCEQPAELNMEFDVDLRADRLTVAARVQRFFCLPHSEAAQNCCGGLPIRLATVDVVAAPQTTEGNNEQRTEAV